MILWIYWTDRFQRRAAGKQSGTPGLRTRLARCFDTTEEIVKKITSIKSDRRHSKKPQRFRSVKVETLQNHVKRRIAYRDRGYR